MATARRQRRAHRNRVKPGAAKRFSECVRLLQDPTPLSPEALAAIERMQAAAPYRPHPQGELTLGEVDSERQV